MLNEGIGGGAEQAGRPRIGGDRDAPETGVAGGLGKAFAGSGHRDPSQRFFEMGGTLAKHGIQCLGAAQGEHDMFRRRQ